MLRLLLRSECIMGIGRIRSLLALGLMPGAAAAIWAQSFTLLPGAAYPAGNGPLAIASGDFNGDGKPDLVVGNTSSSGVSVYLGNGTGGFAPAATVSVPDCVLEFVATGDFNRDGYTDVLAVCALQSTIWVIPGLGTGQFGKPISTTIPNIILQGEVEGIFPDFVVADFNNDGVPDLVLGLIDSSFDKSSFSIDLLLGNGDGTFSLSPVVSAGQSPSLPGVILAGDFDRDGNMDLAVAGGPMNPGTAALQIYLGNGQGAFKPGAGITLPAGMSAGSGTVADVNGDGIPDVILTIAGDSGAEIVVFRGSGDGTFKQISGRLQTALIVGITAAHLRDASTVDLIGVVLDKGSDEFTVAACAGNGDGTFQAGVPVVFPSGFMPWPLAVVAGDWNGDGLTDIAFAALPTGTLLTGSPSSNSLAGLIQLLQSLPAGDLVVILNGATPAPVLAVSNSQLQFSYVAGGTAPLPQTVAVSNSGSGTLNWTAQSDSPWLAVTPGSGSGARNLSISVAPAGLSPATYTGHIQLAASGAAGSPQSVTVTLAVSAPSTAPTITAVVNGASFQPGIESGSWVTILGSNLSKTSPGRTWTASEIVNGNLPQSLDGTSVTIDGKPAYVYYISPTQLNVQAPTDSVTGTVAVVVTNDSEKSVSFSAQLETASPAFFLYPGTSNPIVSRFPDYALVGTTSAPAHPGDVLIIWGTGFGPTKPPTPAGIVVTGAPTTATLPEVTAGGVGAPVSAAVLAPGSAGLYQIAIQLPSTVPTGAVALEASVGGAMSPAGTTIFVSAQ